MMARHGEGLLIAEAWNRNLGSLLRCTELEIRKLYS